MNKREATEKVRERYEKLSTAFSDFFITGCVYCDLYSEEGEKCPRCPLDSTDFCEKEYANLRNASDTVHHLLELLPEAKMR